MSGVLGAQRLRCSSLSAASRKKNIFVAATIKARKAAEEHSLARNRQGVPSDRLALQLAWKEMLPEFSSATPGTEKRLIFKTIQVA